MAKLTEAFCEKCNKKYKDKQIKEIDVVYTCPDCGTSYIDQYAKDEIECTNPDCYTFTRNLLVDSEILEHTKKVAEASEKLGKMKPKKMKAEMLNMEATNKSFKKNLDARKDKDFDHSKIMYKCYHCDKVMIKSEWDKKKGKCPGCKKNNYMTDKRDKTKFVTVPSKHIVAVCPKYHILARYPRRDD